MSQNAIRLTPIHAASYRALMLDAYARHPDAFTSTVYERATLPLAFWEQRLIPRLDAKEVVFGYLIGDELAAVVGVSFDSREKTRHKSTLFGMYVAPQWRGQGFGDQLLVSALAFARTRPEQRLMQLTVTDGNHAAQALYARHGFVPFGLEPLAVKLGDEFVAKVHMWRDLAAGDVAC